MLLLPSDGSQQVSIKNTLPIDDKRIEYFQMLTKGHRLRRVSDYLSKAEKWRESCFTFIRRTAPRRHNNNHGYAVRPEDSPQLNS